MTSTGFIIIIKIICSKIDEDILKQTLNTFFAHKNFPLMSYAFNPSRGWERQANL